MRRLGHGRGSSKRLLRLFCPYRQRRGSRLQVLFGRGVLFQVRQRSGVCAGLLRWRAVPAVQQQELLREEMVRRKSGMTKLGDIKSEPEHVPAPSYPCADSTCRVEVSYPEDILFWLPGTTRDGVSFWSGTDDEDDTEPEAMPVPLPLLARRSFLDECVSEASDRGEVLQAYVINQATSLRKATSRCRGLPGSAACQNKLFLRKLQNE